MGSEMCIRDRVGKWKKVPAKAAGQGPARVIRMRLTLRGFKDRDADSIETFAGTCTRTAH